MDDKDNILNAPFGKADGELKQEKLMAYLDGKLSAEEQHEVERWLGEEGMESDALEGLKMLPVAEMRHSVNKLNTSLRHTLKKKKRARKETAPNLITWITVFIILLLAVVAYFMVKLIT